MSARVLAAFVAIVVAAGGARADRYVAVRAATNRQHELTHDEAKRVFSGHTKTWDDGEAIVLVIGSEDSPAMHWLASELFGVSAKTFLTKLKQDTFRGEIRHPLSADDDAHTIRRVQSGRGVVGIVSEAASKTLPSDVTVLAIRP